MVDRDCPWKDAELTLADLAARLDTTPHKLSEVLDSGVARTFYDFVNGYRVHEVQRRIAKQTNLTPSDFGQAAGA